MKIFYILCAAVLLVSTSCNSTNAVDEIIEEFSPVLPIKINYDGEKMDINYDGQEIKNISNTSAKCIFTYENNLIVNIKFYEGTTLNNNIDYIYSNGKLLVKENRTEYYGSSLIKDTYVYEYPTNEKVQITQTHTDSNSNYYYNITGIYSINNGNIISGSSSGTGTINGNPANFNKTLSNDYIDNFPFKNVTGFDKLFIFDNDYLNFMKPCSSSINILEFTSSSSYGNIYSIYKSTFGYNTSGYPILQTRKSYNVDNTPSSSEPEIIAYEYNR